jgi:hypothetical protein
MPKYFFDSREGDQFVDDDIGIDLDGPEDALAQAAAGLVDLAKDRLSGHLQGISRWRCATN